MKIDLENYTIVELRDSYNDYTLGTILLNKKHTIKDFQDAIYKAKEKNHEKIMMYGNDWEYISEDLKDFDYIDMDATDYVEY